MLFLTFTSTFTPSSSGGDAAAEPGAGCDGSQQDKHRCDLVVAVDRREDGDLGADDPRPSDLTRGLLRLVVLHRRPGEAERALGARHQALFKTGVQDKQTQ